MPMMSVPKMPPAIFKRVIFDDDPVDPDDDGCADDEERIADDDDEGGAEVDGAGPHCISGGINGSDGDAGVGDEMEEDTVCSGWRWWVESLSFFCEVCITRRHGGDGKAEWRRCGTDADGMIEGAIKRDRWWRRSVGDAMCTRTATTSTNDGRNRDEDNVGRREVSDMGAHIMISISNVLSWNTVVCK